MTRFRLTAALVFGLVTTSVSVFAVRAHRVHRYAEAGSAALAAPRRVKNTRAIRSPKHIGEPAPLLAPLSNPGDRAEIRRRIALEQDGTYLPELLLAHDSAVTRWPDRTARPLKVWVQTETAIVGWQPEFADRVRHAFDAWESVGIPVRFVFVPDSGLADVHVTFVDHFDEPISGKTLWARNSRWWIVDANIVLALRHNGGEALDASAMQAIALHEVGHLLGLDHTSDTMNVMAPKVRVRELSAADKATARLLYELPAGGIR